MHHILAGPGHRPPAASAGAPATAIIAAEDALMPRDLILGTAGHIDHGKTSLVKALTGIDCDRLPEEKARGITIDIGFATLILPSPSGRGDGGEGGDYRLGIVDVPGHERFIKNMLAGA